MINLDGEGMMADTIRWKLVPGAMKLIVPATLHFFDDKKPAGSD